MENIATSIIIFVSRRTTALWKLPEIFPLLLLAAGLLAGCAVNRPYRTTLPVYPGADTNRPASAPPLGNPATSPTIEKNAGFNIGYVELDDQGWFWSHKQWRAVKDEITNEAAQSPDGLTMIVFVHGWKNNADFDNGNVQMFRGVLTNLAATLGPRKVFGVYLGWRGLSAKSDLLPIPLGKGLTFYHRKSVAERIGHQGAATQVFTELEMMQDEFNAQNRSPESRAELFIIGHSFGGQLVYSAISQVLIERLVLASHQHDAQRVRSLGDIVILLNPAFEASLFHNIYALANSRDIVYPPDQTPVLAIFTSKSDWATGLAFPAGRRLSSWFESKRPSHGDEEKWLFNVRKEETKNQKAAIYKSVGHDDDYLNYDLNFTNYAAAPRQASLQETLRENNAATGRAVMQPYIFAHTNYACILQPRPSAVAGAPFLNVTVDPRIMDGHNDIANPHMVNFLRDFILFTRTNYLRAQTTYRTQTGK
jgi:hypothetical protein